MMVDPLADHPNQLDQSPYQFGWNNPVLLNDPTGEFPCPQCPAFFTGLAMKAQNWWNNFSGASQRLMSGTSGNVPQEVPMSSQERSLRKTVGTMQDGTTVINSSIDVAEVMNSVPGLDTFGDPLFAAYYAAKGDYLSSGSYVAASAIAGVSGLGLKTAINEGTDATVTYYRVQGGANGGGSYPRISVDEAGNVAFRQQGQLNISKGSLEHAQYFKNLRGEGAEIFKFEVPKWFDDLVSEFTIPQKNYKSNPLNQRGNAPKLVDPNQPGTSLELPEIWSKWLQESYIPGSGAKVN